MTAGVMETAHYFEAEYDIPDSVLSPDVRVDSQAQCLLPGLELGSQQGMRRLVEFLLGQWSEVAPLDYRTCAVDTKLVVYPTNPDSAKEFQRFAQSQAGIGLVNPIYESPNN
ncbi:MAG TPA: hypothetical protein VLG92_01780 [Candidatus Saccharimonadia bacterium]|nr:hypothetical protein [Candidatus Saccharimonadia bacterium]